MTGTIRRSRRADGELTRQRVLRAAVECILDIGYYRSSTNEIARRAGVTWGVLQHQFGTREGLLLEVLHESFERLDRLVADARVEGATLEDRLLAVLAVLEQHYGQPEHLASLQIGLDLVRNPDTSDATRRTVMRQAERLQQTWQPLFAQALGECASEADLVRFAYRSLRNQLVGTVIDRPFRAAPGDAAQHLLLVQGVAATIRAEAARRGVGAP
jgi:AcrR family transcriptional regulator